MAHGLNVWIAIFGIFLGVTLIRFLAVFLQVLRLQIWPMRIVSSPWPSPLTADQYDAVAELEAMGFRRISDGILHKGPHRAPTLLFRKDEAFAQLTFHGGGIAGYPIVFYSFGADGTVLATHNRVLWAMMARLPNLTFFDPYADTLADHWDAHLSRTTEFETRQLTDQQAMQEAFALTEQYSEALIAQRAIFDAGDCCYPTVKTAFKVACAWFVVRRKLATRYHSQVTDGEHQSAFNAHCYAEQERIKGPGRKDVKAWLLGLSIAASLIGWGLTYSWSDALGLVAIILLHESGHAIAMRAFGGRDLTMFFIPFIGAIVTGIPREISAWKQAVIFLAGPLPGMIAGLLFLYWTESATAPSAGVDWEHIARLAIFINAFNLLPIKPLDGGNLLDVALLRRWPRLGFGFLVLSLGVLVALALRTEGISLWVIAVAVGFHSVTQWRILRLHASWHPELEADQQLEHLFSVARRLLRGAPFYRQYVLVKAVMLRQMLRKPRPIESAAVLTVMLTLWSGIGAVTYPFLADSPAYSSDGDQRTKEQLAFDSAYSDADDDAESEVLTTLAELAQKLSPDDPRRVDLAVLQARSRQSPDRQQKLEAILTRGHGGEWNSIADIEREILQNDYASLATAPPEQRVAAIGASIDRVRALAPNAQAGTIEAQLRLAEAVDESGAPDQALSMLTTLRERASTADDCRCEMHRVDRAIAWYYISHQRPSDALAALERSYGASPFKAPNKDIWVTYAWATLSAGKTMEGLQQMKVSAYTTPTQPNFLQRVAGQHAGTGLIYPRDMAYALAKAGQADEAITILKKRPYICNALKKQGSTLDADPFEGWKRTALSETLAPLCH